MGSTDYFQANIAARDLVAVAKTAGEMAEWRRWSLVERFQRELAVKRIKDEIVPYLVESRDRFFGSLIVVVYDADVFDFEPAAKHGLNPPAAYSDATDRLGFLTIDGGNLVALDGQHRLVALREVVNGASNLGGTYRDDIAEDELCVVFIQHESLEKTRRIFNKVNRYARPTNPTDNIITSEDDGAAIVARWLVEHDPPLDLKAPSPPLAIYDSSGEPLVAWRTTRLSGTNPELTTLNVIYQTVHIVLGVHGLKKFDEKHRVNRPKNSELAQAYTWSAEWWQSVIDGIDAYRWLLEHPDEIIRERPLDREWSLLLRPASQVALFQGLAGAVGLGLRLETAVARCNGIDWCGASPQWTDTIVGASGRMSTKQESIRLTGRLITYMLAGSRMRRSELNQLEEDYMTARGNRRKKLPKKAV